MGDFFESVIETASTKDGLTAVLAVGVVGSLLLLAGAEYQKSKPKESLDNSKDVFADSIKYF